MFQTLRTPKTRTPPQPVGCVLSVKVLGRTIRCDAHQELHPDPALLAASLRDVSVKAHRALKMGADPETVSLLVNRIETIERGFQKLELNTLARVAGTIKQRLETGS